MVYTSITDIRLLTNLSTSDVSDANLTSIIAKVNSIINSKINVRVIRESVQYIDEVRTNHRDGSNKVFYLRNWEGKYLGDSNDDATIDTSDVTVYKVDSNNVESTMTVASITYDQCKITLSTAPSNSDNLYVTYKYSTLDPVVPDILINMAATYLACAMAFTKRDTGQMDILKFGNMTLQKKVSEASDTFMARYYSALRDIYSITSSGGKFKDSKVRI